MKIYDMHIHTWGMNIDSKKLLNDMEKAGVYGGCIFSEPPLLDNPDIGEVFKRGKCFEERMNTLKKWTKGYEGRLFPVLWIHPDEENIMDKVHIAAKKGVCGFKIICNDFYVYEEKALGILKEIAKINKPVFFHSGILWDGGVSSKYNRPLNWEALMEIEGLRFSMGHCSWPWIDECIAMYGKFLNSLTKRNTAEMFFDITPGTPEIYRKELLTKLYTIGYDVGHNIMFGSDAEADSYNGSWLEKWLKIDKDILLELGISKENFELLYHKNLMRFLGKDESEFVPVSPVSDEDTTWKPTAKGIDTIIEKWYKKLNFNKEYDKEFYEALKNIKISDMVNIETYDVNCQDGKRNLLSVLYMCEELSEKYKMAGIEENILLETLSDIPLWCDKWSDLKGELYLGELGWLSNHLKFNLFKLGRLQFCRGYSVCDIECFGIKKGDSVIEVHIPDTGKLDNNECKKSIVAAKVFFEKYFPHYSYNYFTCHSWLLDETLETILPADSNILKFSSMFEVVFSEKSDAILKYVFKWDTKRHQVKNLSAETFLARSVKGCVKENKAFYEAIGVMRKDKNI